MKKSRKLAWGVVAVGLTTALVCLFPPIAELLFYGAWEPGVVMSSKGGERLLVYEHRRRVINLPGYKHVVVKRLQILWLPLRPQIVRPAASYEEWANLSDALPPRPRGLNPFSSDD